jgi:hypothetical protein
MQCFAWCSRSTAPTPPPRPPPPDPAPVADPVKSPEPVAESCRRLGGGGSVKIKLKIKSKIYSKIYSKIRYISGIIIMKIKLKSRNSRSTVAAFFGS